MKKKITKIKRKRKINPSSGILTPINGLIGVLEDLKITLANPNNEYYYQDLQEANTGIRTFALKILEKI